MSTDTTINPHTSLSVERVPLKSRIWVSAADGSVAILQGIVGASLTYYFTSILGLGENLSGLAWIIFGIWNAINDPIYGYLTDKTKSKLGRRIPYIRYGAPLITLFYILFWMNADLIGVNQSNQIGLFFYLLICLFFYDILYTAVATALWIMPFEMAVSNKARGSIFIWKIFFSVIAMAFPLAIMPMIVNPRPGDNLLFYRIFHVIVGIFVGIVVFISTFFYKEKAYIQEEEQPAFFKALVACFKNKSFIIFEVASFTIIFVQSALMQGLNYYPMAMAARINMLFPFAALGIGTITMLVLLIRFQRKWGVRTSMMIAFGFFFLGAVLMLIGGKNQWVVTAAFLCMGAGVASGYYEIPIMMGDTMDYDEVITGKRREGMYSGVNSFITKPAISLANAAFLWIAVPFGFNKLDFENANDSVLTGIIIAWVALSALFLLISIISFIWYPLHGKEWNQKKDELTALHKEKERDYLEKLGFKYEE